MIREKQLGQLRPANTTAASLFSPIAPAIIKNIVICNNTASAAAFRLFVDDDGSTYDESTALFYDALIQGNETVQIDAFIPMNNSAGTIAVRTDTGDALTFTAFGAEVT
jgi:hypothetical protein